MISKEVKKVLEKVEHISSIPAIISKILKALENPKITVRETTEVLAQDAAVTAKILQVANSAYYGFPREISTIDKALVILGFQSIRNIVITMPFIMSFSSRKRKGSVDNSIEHALTCAVISKIISDFLNIRNSGEIFVCGLIHDMGKIIIEEYFPKQYKKIVHLSTHNGLFSLKLEEEILGCGHNEIGAFVSERWNFPGIIYESILNHHSPEKSETFPDVVSIVNLANFLARRGDFAALPEKREEIIDFSLKTLAIPGKEIKDFIESKAFKREFNAELKRSKVFLSF